MFPKIGRILLAIALTATKLAAQSGSLTTLTDLEKADGSSYGLIQASDGNFYSSSLKITPSGGLTVLPSECTPAACSSYPVEQLIEGPDGYLYGVSFDGGNGGGSSGCPLNQGCGTIFKISLSGQFTTLYAFCADGSGETCPDGFEPGGGLTLGADGLLYGTTAAGTAFKISTTGDFTTIADLDQTVGSPVGPMVQATDGNFYGVTGSLQVVFKLTPGGVSSVLYSFGKNTGEGTVSEESSLVEGPDGKLYGITYASGTQQAGCPTGCGSIFSVSLAGAFSTVYQFCSLADCADGANPSGPIIFTGPINVVGTTSGTGDNSDDDYGSIFQYNVQSGLSTLYSFQDSTDGSIPISPLALANNGGLYGTSWNGGDKTCTGYEGKSGCGTVFRYDAATPFAAPVQLTFSSSQVQRGKPVAASLKVLNAFSLTMQQCYAFENGTPLGKVPGAYSSSTQLYTFSTSLTPTTAGIYNYAVTCGGVESGFATLTVGDTTQTTLTAAPNPVTPPANDTLTATVTRTTGSGTPTGSVTFSVGTTVLGKAILNGAGVATLAASSKGVAAGTYPVVATYSGDTNDVSSTSAAVDITVE